MFLPAAPAPLSLALLQSPDRSPAAILSSFGIASIGGALVLVLFVGLVLLFVCVLLALYLVKISQAMMAFWITAVLALLYGVIGQFSVETRATQAIADPRQAPADRTMRQPGKPRLERRAASDGTH